MVTPRQRSRPRVRLAVAIGLGTTLLLAGSAPAALAVVHYVSPTGDDGNDGLTITTPKRTIKTTLATLAAGDTLFLLEGTYDRTNQGGDANMIAFQLPAHDVTLSAYPGHVAVIDWTGVVLGGTDRFLNAWNDADGGLIQGITFRAWSNATTFLYDAANDNLHVVDCVFDGVSPTGNYPIVGAVQVRGIVIDGCSFVNRAAGSWYYAIYLEGDFTEGPENHVVRNCQFNGEIDLADSLGWSAGIIAVRVDSLTVSDCMGFNAGSDHEMDGIASHFVDLRDVDGARVSGLELKRYLGGRGQGSFVHEANGVRIVGVQGNPSQNVRVASCSFWGAGHGVMADVLAHDVEISHVWCDSTYDDCVFFNATSGPGSIDHVVSHHAQDNGIDVQGAGVSVRHCTIVRPLNQAFVVAGASSALDVADVIVYDVRDPAAFNDTVVFVDPAAAGWSFDHDLWFDPDSTQTRFRFDGASQTFTAWQAAGHDPNGLWADPLFQNPDGRAWPLGSTDFCLLPGSPAIGAASDSTDIGALGAVGSVGAPPGIAPLAGSQPAMVLRFVPNPTRGPAGLVPGGELGAGSPGIALDPSSPRVVSVFDSAGRLVRAWSSDDPSPLSWDGRDGGGHPVAPGTYFIRLRGGAIEATGRIVVVH